MRLPPRQPVSLLFVALLACAAPAAASDASPAGNERHAAEPRPARVGPRAPDAWVARARRHIAEREYWVNDSRRGLQAPNRAHGLRTYFAQTGIRVHDRASPGGSALVALSLAGVGRGAALSPPEPGRISSDRGRVEIRRGALVEWYENSEAGLEQGFTFAERPPGDGPLVLEVEVEDATPSLRGDAVILTTATGRKLRYGKLAAWDAAGSALAARLALTAAGHVRLEINESGAAYPVVVDPLLTETADDQLEANQADAGLGRSVAGAGDVNGDGYADVIVGAPDYDAGEADEGAAFVFLGSAAGVSGATPATAHAQLEANQAGASLGTSVAGAGDVNGDGYADVIVGAPDYDAGQTDEGAAFVFLGSATGIADGAPSSAHAQLEGDQAHGSFGEIVTPAGDVNGDGYADAIVAAVDYDAPEVDEGVSFVFLGSAAGIADGGPATADTRLDTNASGVGFSGSIASAGDVNGDGFDDIVTGVGQLDGAAVFLGSAAGIPDGDGSTADVSLPGPVGSGFGRGVAGAGDVNGDGYADVIVGAPLYSGGETDEGLAFVYLGSSSGLATLPSSQIESNQAFANLGLVAGAGDVNGDGYADVAVGAPGYDAGETDEGAAFIFLGSATGIGNGALATPSTADARLESDQAGAGLFRVARAGDVNGDGYDDVVVGAGYYDAGEANEGAAFVYLGGAQGVLSGDPTTAHAQLESDQSDPSWAIAPAGDVNGDGYGDVIVGAQAYDSGVTDGGAAFVFLGGPGGLSDATPATAHARLEGDQTGSRFGASAAAAGDVNGDGYGDVVVGAPDYDAGETDEGAVFVFLGSASGISDGGPATAHAQLESDQAASGFGIRARSAGDVNGDGFADVIATAFAYDAGETDEGAAFVFLGSAAGIPDGSAATAHARIESDQAGAQLSSASSAGDINGDGYADVLVGAPFYEIQDDEGAALLFLGSAAGIAGGGPTAADVWIDPAEISTTIPGAHLKGYLGSSVAPAGDMNGDGLDDVLVGEPGFDSVSAGSLNGRGVAFAFAGNENPALITQMGPLAILIGGQAGALFGASVSSAGDVNGDGFADILVGAPTFDAGETNEGAAFVFLGRVGFLGADTSTADAVLESNQAFALLGTVGAADVDGDGFADVLASASSFDAGQTDEGAAFVFLGNGNRSGAPVAARQLRGDASGIPVQPWGHSHAPDAFEVSMTATHPAGRGRVKLEVERCGYGLGFDLSCERFVSPTWIDVGGTGGGAVLTAPVPIPFGDLLVRWRARVLRAPFGVTQPGITAPPSPAHGPWHRVQTQAVEGYLRRQMASAELVPGGMGAGASALGGVGAYGGVEATFDDTTGGTLSVAFAPAPFDEDLPDVLDAPAAVDFQIASDPVLLWEIDYDGSFSGAVTLTFQYDDAGLRVPESELQVEHFENGSWVTLPKVGQDTVANTITVTTSSVSPFALGGSGGSSGWTFSGVAQGGSLEFSVGAVLLSVATTSGQTAEQVAAAVAAAIGADATLAAAGITATADGRTVETDGVVTSTTLDDPGLVYVPLSTEPVPALPLAGLVMLASALAIAARRATSLLGS